MDISKDIEILRSYIVDRLSKPGNILYECNNDDIIVKLIDGVDYNDAISICDGYFFIFKYSVDDTSLKVKHDNYFMRRLLKSRIESIHLNPNSTNLKAFIKEIRNSRISKYMNDE